LIAELEVKFKTLRRRNESLKTDLRAARKQIAKLEKRLESRKKKAKQEVLQPKAPAAAQVVETPVEPPKPAAPKRRVLGRTLAQLRPPKRLPPTPE
jgi:predicted RNase H-like nuclease (RuvC/YqgF family)